MKRGDKLFEEYCREQEEKQNRKLGRKKRMVSVMSSLRLFGDEELYKKLLLWAYKKGRNSEGEGN